MARQSPIWPVTFGVLPAVLRRRRWPGNASADDMRSDRCGLVHGAGSHEHAGTDQRGCYAGRGAPTRGERDPAEPAAAPGGGWRRHGGVGRDLGRVPPEAVVRRQPRRGGALVVLLARTMSGFFPRIHPDPRGY